MDIEMDTLSTIERVRDGEFGVMNMGGNKWLALSGEIKHDRTTVFLSPQPILILTFIM